jgi:hypothetical protein
MQIYLWIKQFQDGREGITNNKRSSQPATLKTVPHMEEVTETVINDH